MQLVQSLDLYFTTSPQGVEAGTTASLTTAQFAHEVTTFHFSLLISLEFANKLHPQEDPLLLPFNQLWQIGGRQHSAQRSATIWQISEPVAYNVRTIIGFCCPCYCSPLADANFSLQLVIHAGSLTTDGYTTLAKCQRIEERSIRGSAVF